MLSKDYFNVFCSWLDNYIENNKAVFVQACLFRVFCYYTFAICLCFCCICFLPLIIYGKERETRYKIDRGNLKCQLQSCAKTCSYLTDTGINSFYTWRIVSIFFCTFIKQLWTLDIYSGIVFNYRVGNFLNPIKDS